ncbi:MAG TPA: MBL fold metallo-hydrolase [Kineosporiaceae bacterium]|nr:MBL fold metallo-hydrolase [Kineosporiaceae bacterium]
MLVTHIGHACLLIETAGVRVLLDPGAFTHGFAELSGLDAVLITHAHPDHYDAERLPALLEANDGARLIVEPELAVEMKRVEIDASGLHPGESVTFGDLVVSAFGGTHALIHDDIPRIGNIGLLFSADGEPTFFHPGDSYASVPEGVDVLGVPLSAPWAALKETVEFVRAVRPRVAVPIHDAIVSSVGRGVYLRNLSLLAPEQTRLLDLAGAGATDPVR